MKKVHFFFGLFGILALVTLSSELGAQGTSLSLTEQQQLVANPEVLVAQPRRQRDPHCRRFQRDNPLRKCCERGVINADGVVTPAEKRACCKHNNPASPPEDISCCVLNDRDGDYVVDPEERAGCDRCNATVTHAVRSECCLDPNQCPDDPCREISHHPHCYERCRQTGSPDPCCLDPNSPRCTPPPQTCTGSADSTAYRCCMEAQVNDYLNEACCLEHGPPTPEGNLEYNCCVNPGSQACRCIQFTPGTPEHACCEHPDHPGCTPPTPDPCGSIPNECPDTLTTDQRIDCCADHGVTDIQTCERCIFGN